MAGVGDDQVARLASTVTPCGTAKYGIERVAAVADIVGLVDEALTGFDDSREQLVIWLRPTTVVMTPLVSTLRIVAVAGVGDVGIAGGVEGHLLRGIQASR